MKLILLTKRSLASIAFCALIGAAAAAMAITSTVKAVQTAAEPKEVPVYRVEAGKKQVAISFDAAWGDEETPQLLEILDKYEVKATFFLVGDWVDKYPESVRALADAGNEVMNHSTSHAHFSKLSHNEIVRDVNLCSDKIEQITGVRPTLFRCPYGEYDDHVIQAVNSLGMTAVQWDVDSLDWKGISAEEIQRRVLDRVQPGSIVLFHNAAENTPEALPGILESLIANGYRIVPISQLLLQGDCFIDNTGRQCRN